MAESKIPENPSAFPKQPTMHLPQGVTMVTEQGGMALRDYFAAAALPIFATLEWDSYSELADAVYDIADAMLAERAKGGK